MQKSSSLSSSNTWSCFTPPPPRLVSPLCLASFRVWADVGDDLRCPGLARYIPPPYSAPEAVPEATTAPPIRSIPPINPVDEPDCQARFTGDYCGLFHTSSVLLWDDCSYHEPRSSDAPKKAAGMERTRANISQLQCKASVQKIDDGWPTLTRALHELSATQKKRKRDG
jgi:hypothetical protein